MTNKITPMRAISLKESLSKTVRLLVKDGITVQFRGFQPYVETDRHTGKVNRLVLPEITDKTSEGMIAALNGYVDHECGHIFYTDFKRIPNDEKKQKIANLIEDVRLEKLLPRDLPGTKENLERTYEYFIPEHINKSMQEAIKHGAEPGVMFGMVLIPFCRAAGGQKMFIEYMDKHDLWKYMSVLEARYPEVRADLLRMETYDEVLEITDKMMDAINDMLPPQAGGQGDESEEDDDGEESDEEAEGSGEGDSDDESEDESEGGDSDDGDSGDSDDDGSDDDGDDESDEEADGDGDDADDGDESDGASGNSETDDNSEGDDANGDDKNGNDNSGSDDQNKEIMDALKHVNPLHRKALYKYKQKKKSTTQIAKEMNCSKADVEGYLKEARSTIHRVMQRSEK